MNDSNLKIVLIGSISSLVYTLLLIIHFYYIAIIPENIETAIGVIVELFTIPILILITICIGISIFQFFVKQQYKPIFLVSLLCNFISVFLLFFSESFFK
ncbi:hypothetical protein DCO56_17320 [Sphingobacterium athyrii]|uniref:Uncharacterized protein n=1 Tax=Sphingobacterium athyrii TaxID=2152717 RepID=A0A363NSB3_9SPHI|nr:hypothetical protein DCO56_17320 [Sphingobacterium athyrii]